MQQRLLQAQEELARAQVTGTAGGGLVNATVTGGGEVVALEIDPTAIDPADAEGLADLCSPRSATPTAPRASCSSRRWARSPRVSAAGGGLGLPGL